MSRIVVLLPLAFWLTCAVAADADHSLRNLLRNPGFEKPGSDMLPAYWTAGCTGGSRADRVTPIAHTGKACGHIVKVADGTSHVAALVYPHLDVRPGVEYTLSGWAKERVSHGSAKLFLYAYDKNGKWLGNYFHGMVPGTAGEWRPLHHSAKTGANWAWVQIRFEIYGKDSEGEAWVDDVYFGCDSVPPEPVRNLRLNDRGGSRVRLTWDPPVSGNPFGYRLYGSPYRRFMPVERCVVGFTRQTAAEVTVPEGYVFYFAVCAVDEALNPSAPVISEAVRRPGARALPDMLVWSDGPGKRWDQVLPLHVPAGHSGITLDLCRGEWGNAQILVGAPRTALQKVTVAASPLRGPGAATLPDDAVNVLLQDYVRVDVQARLAPDPLVPSTPANIAVGELQGWWLLVHVPDTTPPGDYTGRLTIRAEGQPPATVPVYLKIWPITLPRGNHYGGSWGLWGHTMAAREGVKPGSEEYRKLFRRYLDFFLEHRMIPRALPGDIRSPESARWLDDERVASFAIPSPAGWNKEQNEKQTGQFKDLVQFLRDRGWLSKGYCYWSDEPNEKQYPHVVQLAKQAHAAGRDVRFLITEQPEPALLGSIDIWCPILSMYAQRQDQLRRRQKLGEHAWWYVCLGPQPPWPNYLLTNDPIDARVLSWLQVKYHVEGELYWSTTCFPGDVWSEALPHQWPGDGYLCYPGKPRGLDGPATCIRAEMIRAAKQDIELIHLLRKTAEEHGQRQRAEVVITKAIAKVCTDFTKYTKSDADIRAAREMILSAIVDVSR